MAYDVFLSHNSKDKAFVRGMSDWLNTHGVSCFLDEQVLLPGDVLTDKLGAAMEASRSAVICIGPEGEGPWHKEEIDTLLNRSIKLSRKKNEFRLIPVLLPGANTANLRWFLETRLWCDLSKGLTSAESELERLKRAILGERGASPLLSDPHFNPYRGLEPYDRDNASFFFGRIKEIRELAQRLKESRFACIVGPSGNGKSSLARAGLNTDTAKAIIPSINQWERITAMPGNDLLRAILNQLYAKLPNEERADRVDARLKAIVPDVAELTSETWARGLDMELQSFYAGFPSSILIFVDQFEELFTHRGIIVSTEEVRQGRIRVVLDGLAHMVHHADKRWVFVFTLRSDFLQRCRISPAFWSLLEQEHLSLPLDELNEEGWREAIKGPATRSGAYLEAGLTEILLKDVYCQRGSMPLLQLALQELWKLRDGSCLTHAAYAKIGGVANALQARAETVLSLLKREDAAHQDIARNLFLRLTSPGEGVSDTRRRMDTAELDWVGEDRAKIDHVVTELSNRDNRLVVSDQEAIEVTHEVLIRECSTIRAWIEASRLDISMLRSLTRAARNWAENGRDPQFLDTAGPPRELKAWIRRSPLRFTRLEQEFWLVSRAERLRRHRDKRRQKRELQALQRKELEQAATLAAERKASLDKQVNATRRLRLIASAAVVAAVVAIYLGWQAEIAKEEAQEAMAKHFVRTIGTTEDVFGEHNVLPDEIEALWQLSELKGANAVVKDDVIEKWCASPELLRRATANDGLGLKAAQGLQLPRKQKIELLTVNLASRLVVNIGNQRDGNDMGLMQSSTNLERLLPLMPREEAAISAKQCAETLVRKMEQLAVNDNGHFRNATERTLPLLSWLSPQDSTHLAKRATDALFKAIEVHRHSSSGPDLVDSAMASAELFRYRTSTQNFSTAVTNVRLLLDRIERLLSDAAQKDAQLDRPVGIFVVYDTGRLFTALSKNLAVVPTQSASDISDRAAEALLTVLMNKQPLIREFQYYDLEKLRDILQPLLSGMRKDRIRFLADALVQRISDSGEPESSDANTLVVVIEAMGTQMDAGIAVEMAERISTALESKEMDLRRCAELGIVLNTLIKKMNQNDKMSYATRGCKALTRALKGAAWHRTEQPSETIGDALTEMAHETRPLDALEIANELAKGMASGSSAQSLVMGRFLIALSRNIETKDATVLALSLIECIEHKNGSQTSNYGALGESFAGLVNRVDPAASLEVVKRGLKASVQVFQPKAMDTEQLDALARSLALLLERMPHDEAMLIAANCASRLFEKEAAEDRALALAYLSLHIRSPSATRLFALSETMSAIAPLSKLDKVRVSRGRSEAIKAVLSKLSVQELVEVLKWPFCVGEAEKFTLEALETRTGEAFGGDVWNFVDKARMLSINNISRPIFHPIESEALNELNALRVSVAGGN